MTTISFNRIRSILKPFKEDCRRDPPGYRRRMHSPTTHSLFRIFACMLNRSWCASKIFYSKYVSFVLYFQFFTMNNCDETFRIRFYTHPMVRRYRKSINMFNKIHSKFTKIYFIPLKI